MNERHGEELDPVRDPLRWEALVGRVMTEARPELWRLRYGESPAHAIVAWWRGLVTGAGLLAAAAALVLMLANPAADASLDDVPAVATALSSGTVAAWLLADEMPTAEQVLAEYEGGAR